MSSNNNILIVLQAVNKTTNVFNKVSAQMNKISNLSVTLNNSISNIFYGIGAWKLFSNSLRMAKDFADKTGVSLITINSWNEWTESSYLLPDNVNGYGYLEAVKKVFKDEK